jgi:non-ribosomal peptide synthetase-like protein
VSRSAQVRTEDLSTVPTADEAPARPIDMEARFAQVLVEVLQVEHVPVDGHFFDDLGADSMTMARFCAKARKRSDLPSVSMKDVYRHPTVRSLATALADAVPAPAEEVAAAVKTRPTPVRPADRGPDEAAPRASTRQFVLTGALQFLSFLAYAYVMGVVIAQGYGWISAGSGLLDTYLRMTLFTSAAFLAVGLVPILAKWVLIGRWTPRQIPVWSLGYYRFWLVKTLIRANPLARLLVGTPLLPLYLRALGARVGRNVLILSTHMPVTTDLLTIGDGTVISKDAFLTGYHAHDGVIRTGRVTLGRGVFIGEKTVLDVDTAVGDGGQLGHTSSLYAGTSVPAGERWHGSPAEPTEVDYVRVEPADCSRLRRATYSVLVLLKVFLLYLPLVEGVLVLLVTLIPSLGSALDSGMTSVTRPQFYLDTLVASAVLFFGSVVLGLVLATTVPRLLNLFLQPDRVYPVYGFHYAVNRTIARMTNVKVLTYLFGDTAFIVHYLKGIGYDLNRVVQTGTNFGVEVRHDNPYLSEVGSGSMVADGLSFSNADYSSTSFRVSQTSIGADNFLGNNIVYPAGGRTGDNCLIATKAMVPLDGEIREGVGLLGSPSFEIPRSVARDTRFDHLRTAEALAAKTRYDIRSMCVFLLVRWMHVFLLVLLGAASADSYGDYGFAGGGAFIVLSLLATVAYYVLVERMMLAIRPLGPAYCSVYDPYFWWQERIWKTPADTYLHAFDGTPFKNVVWRLLGVRIGKRVFDDGLYITERTLATIGDDSTFNASTKMQCHSQEDGAYKAERITIGAGCTLGVGAFVHYGVVMGDGAVLAPDSFLMKGTEVAPHTRWAGNPAVEIDEDTAAHRTGASGTEHGGIVEGTVVAFPPPASLPIRSGDRTGSGSGRLASAAR